jgi:hypothetical protein
MTHRKQQSSELLSIDLGCRISSADLSAAFIADLLQLASVRRLLKGEEMTRGSEEGYIWFFLIRLSLKTQSAFI